MSDITKRKMEQIAQMWNARGKGLIKHMALQIEEVSTEGVRVRMPFNPEFCVDADQTRPKAFGFGCRSIRNFASMRIKRCFMVAS